MATIRQLRNYLDANGISTFAIAPDWINVYLLSAGVAKDCVVPSTAEYVFFNTNVDIWVKMNGIASIPTIDITDGSAPEFMPAVRQIKGITNISIISPNDGFVILSFFK